MIFHNDDDAFEDAVDELAEALFSAEHPNWVWGGCSSIAFKEPCEPKAKGFLSTESERPAWRAESMSYLFGTTRLTDIQIKQTAVNVVFGVTLNFKEELK